MTDDRTKSSGQKNRAPKGSADGPFWYVKHPHRGEAPLSRTFLPKQAIRRSQLAAIYEFMT
ncbi:MAG TPA: hypothetical protein QGH84_00250 [Rhodospirillales bacterium]|jgi:hypothetical protein|nr:hypothetical protein [Rhodospirillales bacterium]